MPNYPLLRSGVQNVTATAALLPSLYASQSLEGQGQGLLIILKATKLNTGIVYVGPSTVTASGATQGFGLDPGESQVVQVSDLTEIFVIGTLNDKIQWLACDL